MHQNWSNFLIWKTQKCPAEKHKQDEWVPLRHWDVLHIGVKSWHKVLAYSFNDCGWELRGDAHPSVGCGFSQLSHRAWAGFWFKGTKIHTIRGKSTCHVSRETLCWTHHPKCEMSVQMWLSHVSIVKDCLWYETQLEPSLLRLSCWALSHDNHTQCFLLSQK